MIEATYLVDGSTEGSSGRVCDSVGVGRDDSLWQLSLDRDSQCEEGQGGGEERSQHLETGQTRLCQLQLQRMWVALYRQLD